MIDQYTIDRVLGAANIVDVVSEYVSLRRRGVNYIGLCPFHSDKSPSFYVSPAKNICKCFACGTGGNAAHFLMKIDNIPYYEAIRKLAKKYNIEIKERELSDDEKRRKDDRESMFIVNDWAKEYFSEQLYKQDIDSIAALRYFKERGFRDDTIKKFELGYSPFQKDALTQAAIQKGFNPKYLVETGLSIQREDGTMTDRFRGRVMFPVFNLSGKVVAFGGRVLKKNEKTAKYVNSPESILYHKSDHLYGLFHAKRAIQMTDKCFLVEGYTDVISMHQSGIENVVASSGTALTQGQINLIHRFTKNITVLYDGDAAGIKAALRGIDLLIEDGMNVKVLLLPDGEDPDSFARTHSASQFTEFIQQHETDFIMFKTKLLLDTAADLTEKAHAINDIINTISLIPEEITRELYVREYSSMIGLSVDVLYKKVKDFIGQREKSKNKIGNYPSPQLPIQDNPNVGTNNPEPPDYPLPPPEYEDIPLSPMPMPEPAPLPPDDSEDRKLPYIAELSPFDKYEKALIHYIIRYGEKILFDADPDTDEPAVRVAEFIYEEIHKDDLDFQNPMYKRILDECYKKCFDEGFEAHRYFLSHVDPDVSQVASDFIVDRYELSSYHSKHQKIETEEERLHICVVKDLFSYKEAVVRKKIEDDQEKLEMFKDNFDEMMKVMQEISNLNKIKMQLSKELGERIILKI